MTNERETMAAMLLRQLLDDGVVRAAGRERRHVDDRRLIPKRCGDNLRRLTRPDERAGQDGVERNVERNKRLGFFPELLNPFIRQGSLGVVGKAFAALGGHSVPDQVQLERLR